MLRILSVWRVVEGNGNLRWTYSVLVCGSRRASIMVTFCGCVRWTPSRASCSDRKASKSCEAEREKEQER